MNAKKRRRIPWILCTALAPLLMAGSCHPDLQEFNAIPALACPGDTIRIRLIAKNYEGGRFDATPAPVAPRFPISLVGSEVLRAEEPEVQVCESTTFRATLWNGDEVACGEDYTVCAETFVSVMTADEVFVNRFPACGGSFAGRAVLTIDERRVSQTAQVREVTNCGERTVTVDHGGRSDRLEPGAPPSGAFTGQSWTGDWVATETVRPPEGCPPRGFVTPLPPPPPPPEICLSFTVGCPPTTDCG